MADPYRHELLVELESNTVPKLKNKLTKFFQSRRLSGGGDCTVELREDCAVVRFKNSQDLRSVLQKEAHLLPLEAGHLKLAVRSGTQESSDQKDSNTDPVARSRPLVSSSAGQGDDGPIVCAPAPDSLQKTEKSVPVSLASDAPSLGSSPSDAPSLGSSPSDTPSLGSSPSDAPLSMASVLGNLAADMSQEFVEMVVENIMKIPVSEGFTVEMIPARKSAVVSFRSAPENAEFLRRCPENRTFKAKGFTVQGLEPPSELLLEEATFNEDLLILFFEKEGAQPPLKVSQVKRSTVVTFSSAADVQKLMQKSLVLQGKKLNIYPFYRCLGRALFGSDRPPLSLPGAVVHPCDRALVQYLSDRPTFLQTLCTQLTIHWCGAELSQDSVKLSPEPELLQQEETILEEWPQTVRSALSQFLSQFEVWKLNPPPDLWKQSLDKVSVLLRSYPNVLLVPEETSGILKAVGLKSDISELQVPLCDSVNSIIKRVRREKEQVTEQIEVAMNVFHLLSQDGLQQDLLRVFPEIQFDLRGQLPKVTGLSEEINKVQAVIYKAKLKLQLQIVAADRDVLELLTEKEQAQRANTMLLQKKAALEIIGGKIQLLARTNEDLLEAEALFKSQLVSNRVEVEDRGVLDFDEWQQLVGRVAKDDDGKSQKVQIRTEGDWVVVSGFKDDVATVSNTLDSFLKQSAHVQVNITVKHVAKVEYLQQLGKLDALVDKGVTVSLLKDGLSLSGSRAHVKECALKLPKLIDSVFFESLTIERHGAREVFEDKDEGYPAVIAAKTGCLVKIVDEADASPTSRSPNPAHRTPDGLEIFVANADLCSYPVHAIVNSAATDLELKSGLAAALLKAAGHQLQVECDKIVLRRGNLKPGDCEVTHAGGSLACQKIIHVVGPKYDKQNVEKSKAALVLAIKSCLALAEVHQCKSLAIPAVCRNKSFPLTDCAQIIVRAVREHCRDRFGEFHLKSVHLVNTDEAAVRAMEDAVKQEFRDTAPPPPPPPVRPSPLPHRAVAFSSSAAAAPATRPADPNCVGKEVTKEGLEFSVVKGNLEKATTDIIVNTVTKELDLSVGAVSKSILSAAGPSLPIMVQAKQSQAAVGEVVVTEGAGLRCQCIFHAVAPHYDNGQGTAQKQLSGVFRDCLSKAEASGMSSISFSAMGTGNLGFPRSLVWSLLLESVQEISSKRPKSLKSVQVVLFPGDTQTIQVFSDEFQKKFAKAPGSSTAAAAPSGGPFSKVVSSSSSHETKLGSATVQVLTGDITKETTDAIINSTSEKFTLKSGVSKAILEAAGPAVEKECQTLGPQAHNGMILTQPGNLRCKNILHLVGQKDFVKIQASVRDALQLCIQHNLCSVALPAIGTGQGNVGARVVADAMLDAVIEVLTKTPNSCLKSVRFVVFQPQMLKDFHQSLLQRSTAATTDSSKTASNKDKAKQGSGMFGALTDKLKLIFAPVSPQKAQSSSDFVMVARKPSLLCLHICGESALKITQAKTKINSILDKTLQKVTIKDEAVQSLSKDAHRQLEEVQRRSAVGVRMESINGQGSICIEGLAADVLTVTTQIHELLKVARQEEDLTQKAALLSAMVEWQYKPNGHDYRNFDPKTSYELEQALESQQKQIKVKLNGQEYTVKLPKGPATSRSGDSLCIQRVNKMSDLPESWETMDTTSTRVLPVTGGSAEYREVEQLFRASCNRNITKIERIQNPVLWQSLQIKRRAMDQKNSHSNNERRLFHGTSQDTIAFINEHGFNRSYAGKNATAYGNGTYFAVNAHYSSSDTYSRPDSNGNKFMYLCSVLTGDFTKGAAGMIEPPLKKTGSIERFDSVVDSTSRPNMFIIFHDSHAYPEYLITFK